MSAIGNIKLELDNLRLDVHAAHVKFIIAMDMRPFTLEGEMRLAALGEALEAERASLAALAESLQVGCDYFTLTRTARAMRKRLESTFMGIATFLDTAEPAVPTVS